MFLHEDKELFMDILGETAKNLSLPTSIVEKDYYVTLFLKLIVQKQPDIIFKGGTSLSKCFKHIDRFSEDIDLNLECSVKPTEGQRQKLKENILSVIEEMKLSLTNLEDIRSRRDYNRYIVDYPCAFNSTFLKQNLIVETAVFIRAYPSKKMPVTSFIYDYLLKNNHTDIIEDFALQSFEINVQTAERTFIDKIFALADYYLSDSINGHSRHIYDLYKLSRVVALNDDLKELFNSVKEDRKQHRNCISARSERSLTEILKEIVAKEVYRSDYNNITLSLLFEPVSYDEVISVIRTITESGITDWI